MLTLTSAPAYNKWHETELERWLSDNNIPYPTPADRRDLEKLVQKNWDSYVVAPYQNWDTDQLTSYLKLKGIETKESAKKDKNSLVSQVQSVWYETEDKAQSAWSSVRDWILDTWTESQLKSFCDHNGIPGKQQLPLPRYSPTHRCPSPPADRAQSPNLVSVTLFSRRPDPTTRPWPRKQERLLPTLAIGCTRLGLVSASRARCPTDDAADRPTRVGSEGMA